MNPGAVACFIKKEFSERLLVRRVLRRIVKEVLET